MNINLSEAYKILAQLEVASQKKSLDTKNISDEINTVDQELLDDICIFNEEIKALDGLVKNNKQSQTKAQLIHLRGYAMNISSTINNFIDEIDTFFQNTDLYEE